MSATTALLVQGADLAGDGAGDVLVVDGTLRAVGPDAAQDAPQGVQRLDADGLVLLPGLVDLHTHLRQPGKEDAETVETGTRAAALGGYTAVHAMANSTPVK